MEHAIDHQRLLRVIQQHLRSLAALHADFVPIAPLPPTDADASVTPTAVSAAPPAPHITIDPAVAPAGSSISRGTPASTASAPAITPHVPGALFAAVRPASSSSAPDAAGTPGVSGPPELPAGEKQAALDALRAQHDTECPHCTTATAHTQTVFGEGNPDAMLMFIGEAPGETEDQTGRPFVGRAGEKLNQIIEAMKLTREDVYIANVLKSRPPNNRTPTPEEVTRCGPYLIEQIRIIRPRVIVTLGGPATKHLLQTREGITRLRGTWAAYDDGSLKIPIMPTFHPAYLLRNYTKDTRQKVWSDMQAVIDRLSE